METNKKSLIFLVDDDDVYLDTLEHNLNKNASGNFILKKYLTGEQCLEELHQNPDIVILDYQLNTKDKTAMNGIEILKRIKAQNREVQVIMLSGQDSLEVAVNCIKNGAYDYLIKNESAFVRAAQMIKNLVYNITLQRDAKKYENWNWIIAGGFLLIIIIDIIYAINHFMK
ncbi:MAG TPA: response regulator [Bacteroidia bacterium]|nr:response regulator [Bacteroidia bacterium]